MLIYKIFNKRKKIILSAIIFLLVLIILGLPFHKWGFLRDDFGVILRARLESWRDFLALFYEGDSTQTYQASNFVIENKIFKIFYRPLAFVLHYIQSIWAGFNPYRHLLAMIVLHGINSVLLFHTFLFFMGIKQSFFFALFFAFHPSLCDWMGWICTGQQVANFTLILCSLIFFNWFLNGKKSCWYLFSIIFFLLSLFMRETALVLPIILAGIVYFQKNNQNKFDWIYYIKLLGPYILVSIFYLILRLMLFPVKSVGGDFLIIEFFSNLKDRFFDVVTFLCDAYCLNFLPSNHRIVKGSLIILICSTLFFLFINNAAKKKIIFLLLGMAIIMWPAIVRYYSSRYFYKGIPFFILAIFYLFKYSKTPIWQIILKHKKSMFCLTSLLLAFNACFLFKRFRVRESFLHELHLAFDDLCHNKKVQNRVICFIGIPFSELRYGVAQAVWMRGVNTNLPIYCQKRTFTCPIEGLTETLIKVLPIKNGIKIWTENPSKIIFHCEGDYVSDMGKAYFTSEEITILFDAKYLNQNMLFITWDYALKRFSILDELEVV